MSKVQKRTWLSRGPTGHKVRKVAWGYTLQVDGKQERKYSADWSREDAQTELDARRLQLAAPPAPPAAAPKTFDQVATEYLEFKRGKGKRSVAGDELHLRKLRSAFGDELPIAEITAHRIAQYDRQRAAETSRLGRKVAPATLNRELATLRHLLRLAEEWGYIAKAPRIRMAKELEGRLPLSGRGGSRAASRGLPDLAESVPPCDRHASPAHGHAPRQDPRAHLGAHRLRARRHPP